MSASRAVLDVLLENARYDVEDIARQTDLDADDVEAAIADLESSGAVRGYKPVVDWNNVEEEYVRAEVELNVELDRETSYADIARRIARYPAVDSLKLVSGNYDFAVDVQGPSMQEVSQFVSEQIAPIPEVTQTVTHFVMETYKDSGIEFDDYDEDDRLSVSP